MDIISSWVDIANTNALKVISKCILTSAPLAGRVIHIKISIITEYTQVYLQSFS